MGAQKLALNLSQRKVVQQFQDDQYKTWKASFDKLVGFSMTVDPQWETFFLNVDNMADDTIKNCWQEFFFDTLTATFTLICTDSMGKKAVKEGVKKVVITGMDTVNADKCTFEDGVFNLNHNPVAYGDGDEARAEKWQKIIEAGL